MQPTHQAVISNPKPVNSLPLRQSPSPPRKPHAMVWPTPDTDPEDFSHMLKIFLSPSPRPCQFTKARKLFNPDTDPIPMRRTADPEPSSKFTQQGSRPPPSSTNHRDERGNPARPLFDHRKDDLVRFSVRPQLSAPGRPSPTLKPSGDHVSALSTSSYAASISSSAFTLSSTTDGSSTPRPSSTEDQIKTKPEPMSSPTN